MINEQSGLTDEEAEEFVIWVKLNRPEAYQRWLDSEAYAEWLRVELDSPS